MVFRSLLSGLLLLAGTAAAQPADNTSGRRIDVLTGEPVRPRGPSRPQPVITNAPHAPRQTAAGADGPPMEVLVAPQIGVGQAGMGQAGMGAMLPTGPAGVPVRPFRDR